MTTLQKRLAELGACEDAIEWVGKRTLARAIARCDRADWLMWLQMRMACEGVPGWSNPREVIGVLLEYVPEDELPDTRRWAAGKDVRWDELYLEFMRTDRLSYSRISLAASRFEDGRYSHAVNHAAGVVIFLPIPPEIIRERLRRGRTLGRKAAA